MFFKPINCHLYILHQKLGPHIFQVLDQSLVLTSALRMACARVARHLGHGWTAEDLEALIPSYAEEPGLKEGTLAKFGVHVGYMCKKGRNCFRGLDELQEVHQSCLESGSFSSQRRLSGGFPSDNPWISDDFEMDSQRALQILKDLSERKACSLAKLQNPSGPEIIKLCAQVEEDFWREQLLAESPERFGALGPQVTFGPAVVALDATSSFQEKYTKLIKDIETQLPKLESTH